MLNRLIILVLLIACGILALGCGENATLASAGDAQTDAHQELAYNPGLSAVAMAADPSSLVDPRVGTGGSGNVFYGVTLPHSMLKLGPDTDNGGMDIKGYTWDAKKIQAFSHTHLDGPGGSAYGYSQIALLPSLHTPTADEAAYAAPFSHATESATVGKYSVILDDSQIKVELTATQHCGWHRYQMPAGTSRLAVSLAHTRGKSTGGHIENLGEARMALRGDYDVHPLLHDILSKKVPETGLVSVYADVALDHTPTAATSFAAGKVLPAATSHEGANLLTWLEFSSAQAWTLNAHVCLSLLSPELARQHRGQELASQTFEQVQKQLETAWNSLLGRVQIAGAASERLRTIYTALYHAMLQPADYTEDGQFWNGALATPAAQSSQGRHFYTDDWCVWDTVHTVHPLLTLLAPELVGDMLQSLVWLSGPDGYLPKCPWHASGDSRVMTGNFTFCLLADAVQKGLTQFDVPAAYAVAKHGGLSDSQNPSDAGLCGYLNQGSPPFYVQNGWVPAECDVTQGASMTLEHAYSDWCLGVLAGQQGDQATAAQMAQRAHNWQNTWGPHGFPQLRKADGSWKEPFDPKALPGFTEANAWIYQWTVSHEPLALAKQLGGLPQALARLDEFFDGGHFDMANEPDFHAPWLYADFGQPWRASERVRALVDKHFTLQPGGLPGNDDAGATSAWLVFAALGLYPTNPGDGLYTLTAPLFERVDMQVGKSTVHIVAPGAASLPHILSAKWNGKLLQGPKIAHGALAKGGWLELELGAGASNWGVQTAAP